MKLFLKILKWAVGLIMVFCLIFSVCELYVFDVFEKQIAPTSVNELEPLRITIKEVTKHSNIYTLTAQEYSNSSFSVSVDPNKDDLAASQLSVNAGDQVDIYIRKKDEESLAGKPGILAYGLKLTNGQYLVDPNKSVTLSSIPQLEPIRIVFLTFILIPLLYLSIFTVLQVCRHKKSKAVPRGNIKIILAISKWVVGITDGSSAGFWLTYNVLDAFNG